MVLNENCIWQSHPVSTKTTWKTPWKIKWQFLGCVCLCIELPCHCHHSTSFPCGILHVCMDLNGDFLQKGFFLTSSKVCQKNLMGDSAAHKENLPKQAKEQTRSGFQRTQKTKLWVQATVQSKHGKAAQFFFFWRQSHHKDAS